MKHTHTRIEEVHRSITFGLSCDFCGISYLESGMDELLDAPITAFSITPGYGSCYDDDQYNLEICDRCLSRLLAQEEVSLCKNIEVPA